MKFIDRRTQFEKKDAHPDKEMFKGRKVAQMTQAQKDKLLEILAEIGGLL